MPKRFDSIFDSHQDEIDEMKLRDRINKKPIHLI